MTTWRQYELTPRKPQPKHREPADMTARSLAIHDSLTPEVRDEIHEAARAYAVGVMERFEMERRRR